MTPTIRRAQTARQISEHRGAGVALLVVGVLVTELLSHWPRIWAAVWGLTR